MYKYVLNSVAKISMMFAKYFEHYTIILGGAFFVETLHTHFLGLLQRNRILPRPKFTLHPTLAFSYTGSVTACHLSSGHRQKFVASYRVRNFCRGSNLYSARRPSRWASAHILVSSGFHVPTRAQQQLRWATVWPQWQWAKKWGHVPFWGEGWAPI